MIFVASRLSRFGFKHCNVSVYQPISKRIKKWIPDVRYFGTVCRINLINCSFTCDKNYSILHAYRTCTITYYGKEIKLLMRTSINVASEFEGYAGQNWGKNTTSASINYFSYYASCNIRKDTTQILYLRLSISTVLPLHSTSHTSLIDQSKIVISRVHGPTKYTKI